MQSVTIATLGAAGIAIGLMFAAGLTYYVRIALKSRTALGLGWHFDRDDQPIRYWMQITVVAGATLDQLAKVWLAAVALTNLV